TSEDDVNFMVTITDESSDSMDCTKIKLADSNSIKAEGM
ncbi:hypothetical protein A2U01_0115298, partial [Trifolium medium]|nr:hypothetical protein [Trifolium medium]